MLHKPDNFIRYRQEEGAMRSDRDGGRSRLARVDSFAFTGHCDGATAETNSGGTPSMRHETDAIVIGAGPVGLFAVFELGMVGLKCHVVDALPAIGGQLTALYPEKPIYDIPGFPRILATELVERLAEQASPFRPRFHLEVTVESLLDSVPQTKLLHSRRTEVMYSKGMLPARHRPPERH